jgi:photosystem II stability/assembly factor-like uncharacterized protein
VLSTTDGGATWRKQNTPTREDLHAVFFVSPATGWAVGNVGTILATSDGGATWRGLDSTARDDLLAVYFADAARGWAAGASGTILATLDGGATWVRHDSGTPFDLHAIRFGEASHGDALRGWAAGANGTLLTSIDGGVSWQAVAQVNPGLSVGQVAPGLSVGQVAPGQSVGQVAPGQFVGQVAPGQFVGQARDTAGATNFLGLGSAGPTRIWAVGGDGSVVSVSLPDTGAITAATHLPALRTALRSAGVSEDRVAPLLSNFAAADADLVQREADVARARLAPATVPEAAALGEHASEVHPSLGVAARPPGSPAPMLAAPVVAAPGSAMSDPAGSEPAGSEPAASRDILALARDPMLLTIANRIGIAAFVLLASLILMAIVRRAMRLTTQLEARADALALNGGVVDNRYDELVASLLPDGAARHGRV